MHAAELGEAGIERQRALRLPGQGVAGQERQQQQQGGTKQVQKGGMYYLVDANGIVKQGPSQSPLQ